MKKYTGNTDVALSSDFLKLRHDNLSVPLEFFNYDEMRLFAVHGGDYSACLDDDELDSMDGRRTQMSNKTKDKKGKAVSRNLVA
jgi:hypothetical protein